VINRTVGQFGVHIHG